MIARSGDEPTQKAASMALLISVVGGFNDFRGEGRAA
jgi:hypothetical protein